MAKEGNRSARITSFFFFPTTARISRATSIGLRPCAVVLSITKINKRNTWTWKESLSLEFSWCESSSGWLAGFHIMKLLPVCQEAGGIPPSLTLSYLKEMRTHSVVQCAWAGVKEMWVVDRNKGDRALVSAQSCWSMTEDEDQPRVSLPRDRWGGASWSWQVLLFETSNDYRCCAIN